MRDQNDTPTLADAGAVIIRPGDRVVLMFPDQLPTNEQAQVLRLWEEFAPDTKCLVLGGGASVAVIREDGG